MGRKKNGMRLVKTSLVLREDAYQWLELQAKKAGISKSKFIQNACIPADMRVGEWKPKKGGNE